MPFKPCRDDKGAPFPNFEISERGEVRCTLDNSMEIETLDRERSGKTYRYVYLRHAGVWRWFPLHRIMAFSWVGPSPHVLRNIVDHRDGDSLNNAVWNLRYVTVSVNNLNRTGVCGVVKRDGMWFPRFCHFIHRNFASECKEHAQEIRAILLESYIRYSNRFPGHDDYPHERIFRY